jgi:endonuclease YncB( thermonuclease family)
MGADTPFTYYFWVDHVYDGDTVMGRLDMGLEHYLGGLPSLQQLDPQGAYYSLRLYGINAPEMNATDPATRTAAVASRDHLRSLVSPGDYIRVVSYSWDKYGMRIDAIPYTVAGADCCQAQLDGGFAVPYKP